MTTRPNSLNQDLDVAGSLNQTDSAVLANEPLHLGVAVQSGAGASVTAGSPATITGLLGMLPNSEGNYLSISGSGLGNDGNYLITNYISALSVQVLGPALLNEGGLGWVERRPYTLQDDLNFERTDRSGIKGVSYNSPIPTYYRCTDLASPIPVNLTNISGKTTDAKSIIVNRKFDNAPIIVGDGYITISDPGNIKHADGIDITGVPVFDGFDVGNDEGTYAGIFYDNTELYVLAGINTGYRIFGRTRSGTTGISPDSVEIEFRAVAKGDDISLSVPYIWEAGQPLEVDIFYGYRDCLFSIDENSMRKDTINGLIGGAGVGSGPQGPQGVPGADGPQGPQGEDGYGAQGPQGDEGVQGPQGFQGNQGLQGLQGSQGFQGDTGLQGPQGFQGNQGDAGPQGFQGDTGAQGPQGEDGNIGPQGTQGFQGDTGLQGPQGEDGYTGPQGDEGAQGPQGFQGDEGAQGPQGDIGQQGPQGDIGNQGFQGDVGSQGPQGEDGYTGPQGDEGAQGPQGFQGNQGDEGAQGPQGFQGEDGYDGPQGPQGDEGAQGPQGFQGNQGDEGAQGPQGFQGDTGLQGPQGFQGNQGDEGAQGPQGFQGDSGTAVLPDATQIGQVLFAVTATQFSVVLPVTSNYGWLVNDQGILLVTDGYE